MAEVSAAETGGNMAVSPGGPGDHLACDAAAARQRERAQADRRKLAEIAAYILEHKGDAGFSWVHALDIQAIISGEVPF